MRGSYHGRLNRLERAAESGRLAADAEDAERWMWLRSRIAWHVSDAIYYIDVMASRWGPSFDDFDRNPELTRREREVNKEWLACYLAAPPTPGFALDDRVWWHGMHRHLDPGRIDALADAWAAEAGLPELPPDVRDLVPATNEKRRADAAAAG